MLYFRLTNGPIRSRAQLTACLGGASHQTLWSFIGRCALSPWFANQSGMFSRSDEFVTENSLVFMDLLCLSDGMHWWRAVQHAYTPVCQNNSPTPAATWTSWSRWDIRRRFSTCLSLRWGDVKPSCQSWIMWVKYTSENTDHKLRLFNKHENAAWMRFISSDIHTRCSPFSEHLFFFTVATRKTYTHMHTAMHCNGLTCMLHCFAA